MEIPRLHIVTDDGVLARRDFRAVARALVVEGGERVALHVRGPATPGRAILDHARSCSEATRESGARLMINDRLDVALAVAAWGVQIGRRSFSIADVLRVRHPRLVIGASVHGAEEAGKAALEGADFLVAGTLYSSPSHPESVGSGVDWLRMLTAGGPPVIGIGGVTAGRVAEVLEAGAHGVAVISGIWDAADPVAALHEYLNHLAQIDV